MMDQKFQFQLTLVPTDIGCKYYPIIEKVQKTVTWDKNSGENGSLTSEWQGQKFSKASVGLWVYDARIIDPDGKQYQQNLNNCMYTYTTETEVKLDAGNVDSINQQIKDVIGDSSGQAGNGLYDGMVTFILPSGEIEGQIVVPKTDYMITPTMSAISTLSAREEITRGQMRKRLSSMRQSTVSVRARPRTASLKNTISRFIVRPVRRGAAGIRSI